MIRPVGISAPEGELDMSTVDDVDQGLERFPLTDHLIIDLGRVSFVDSVTLARFVLVARRHEEEGSRVVLADARGPVRRILAITQLDTVLSYTDDVESARALVASLDRT